MKWQLKRFIVPIYVTFAVSCIAQSKNDWPMYGYDAGSSRFSPLTDVNTQNVANLKRAWTYHMAPVVTAAPAAPTTGLAARLRQRRTETTPVVVDGVLYMPTPYNRVIALDAISGEKIWEYKIPNNANASTRGIAYWPGNAQTQPRIVFGTSDGSLIALWTLKTGKPA